MQAREPRHRVDDLVGEEPGQRRDHAGELGVALAVVVGAVELVQEEARGRLVARLGKQVGVGVGEAALLVGLQGLDAGLEDGAAARRARSASTARSSFSRDSALRSSMGRGGILACRRKGSPFKGAT